MQEVDGRVDPDPGRGRSRQQACLKLEYDNINELKKHNDGEPDA